MGRVDDGIDLLLGDVAIIPVIKGDSIYLNAA